jgi:purine-binding chemotaxis protein CheW
MSNSPKPRSTKRRKRAGSAANSELISSESPAVAVAIAEEDADLDSQKLGTSDAVAESTPAESISVAVGAAQAGRDQPPGVPELEDVAVEDDELRIRTVQELVSLPEDQGQVELLLFRLGDELFAFDLVAAEEAVELELLHKVPDMPSTMLGVFDLRGRLVPVYSPSSALRSPRRQDAGVLLLMRVDERRVGLAVDDVEDVMMLERAMLRPPPMLDGEAQLLLGVAFFGDSLVSILDARSLITACAATTISEAA